MSCEPAAVSGCLRGVTRGGSRPQRAERRAELTQSSVGQCGAQPRLELCLERACRLCQRLASGERQLDDRRATILGVRASFAVARGLDRIDELAHPTGRQRQLSGDVVDPTIRGSRDYLHRLELVQGQIVLGPKARVYGVPELCLEADQVAEKLL